MKVTRLSLVKIADIFLCLYAAPMYTVKAEDMFSGVAALSERKEKFSLKFVMLFSEALLQAVKCLSDNITSGDE